MRSFWLCYSFVEERVPDGTFTVFLQYSIVFNGLSDRKSSFPALAGPFLWFIEGITTILSQDFFVLLLDIRCEFTEGNAGI